MTAKRKYAILVVPVGIVALWGCSLWYRDFMRVPPLPTPASRTRGAVQTEARGDRHSSSGCPGAVGEVEIPCSGPDTLVDAVRAGDAATVERLAARPAAPSVLGQALLATAILAPGCPKCPPGKSPEEVFGFNYARMAALLLEKGANIEARDQNGATPLIAAAGHGEDTVVKLLLGNGARIEAKDNAGETALIAAACNCPSVDMPDTYDSVRALLEQGANVEARDKRGRTALRAAAEWGRDRQAQLLLDSGARIEDRDNHGDTALLIAASGRAYPTADAVRLLLTGGAEIDARNDNGDTPLILAASNGGYEDAKIVRMLLRRGVDRQARNKQGHTAPELARKKGRTEIAAILATGAAIQR